MQSLSNYFFSHDSYAPLRITCGPVLALTNMDSPLRAISLSLATEMIKYGAERVAGPTIGFYASLVLPAFELLRYTRERVERNERRRIVQEETTARESLNRMMNTIFQRGVAATPPAA